MKFSIFELERVQSIFENTVDFNLTESGFHPYTLNELLTPGSSIDRTGPTSDERNTMSALPVITLHPSILPRTGVIELLFVSGGQSFRTVVA